MKTVLELDERLIEDVRALSGARTIKAAVEAAMREYVQRKRASKLLALEGRLELAVTVEDLIQQRRRDVSRR